MKPSNLHSKVQTLLTDPNFLEMEVRLKRFSLFSIVGQTNTERWHSAFIAWLLNTVGSHELGDFVLRRLLTTMVIKSGQSELPFEGAKMLPSLVELEQAEFSACDIMPNPADPETNKEKDVSLLGATGRSKRKRIKLDIAMTINLAFPEAEKNSRKLLFLCENKVKAKESDKQTVDYADWALNQAGYPLSEGSDKSGKLNFKCLLYLSPGVGDDGRGCAKSTYFINMNYQELVDTVLFPARRHPSLSLQGRQLLDEFFQNLSASDLAVSPYDQSDATSIWEKHEETLKDLLSASEALTSEDDEPGTEQQTTGKWVLVRDLVSPGFLKIGSRLRYQRKKTDRIVTIAEKDGLVGIEVDGNVYRSVSSAARAILGGQVCQGWPRFIVVDEDSDWRGKTLDVVRKAFRDNPPGPDTSVGNLDTTKQFRKEECKFADAVLEKNAKTFLLLESAIQHAVTDDFVLPSRHTRSGGAHVDYSPLAGKLDLDDLGRVQGYFKGVQGERAAISFSGKRAVFYSNHWKSGVSGLEACRKFAKLSDQENKSGAYQWSQYWYVADGKHKDRSFKDAYDKEFGL